MRYFPALLLTLFSGSLQAQVADDTQLWNTQPNFPASDQPPTEATPSLPNALKLGAGSVSIAAYDFTPSGNVHDRATLDADFYYQSIFGDQNETTGINGIDGQHSDTFTVDRTYPASSPYNLLNFTSTGLNLGVICSQNNTAAGCTKGNVYGTLLRPPVVIQKGEAVLVSMKGANNSEFYTGPAEYAGVEKTPGAGSTNAYANGQPVTNDPNCYGENDGQDDYAEPGVTLGRQLKVGIIPAGSYANNGAVNGGPATGLCFKTAPYVIYGANGPQFTFHQNSPYIPFHSLNKASLGSAIHNYVWYRWNDGSNRISYFFDGRLTEVEYYEQSPTNPGWSLVIETQTIPTFACPNNTCPGPYKPNNGGPIIGGAWSATISVIKVIKTSSVASTAAADTNGANSAEAIGGLTNAPP